ncbi:hypothetical protein SUGI_0095150 [Cryptomeria japonica]|nr:hypothetical protein SUGI_0095150 [Cryptomeria japonica]
MNCLHAIMVSSPAQGSINPLMNLAHLLSSRRAFITFVNTEWTHNRMSREAAAVTSTFKFLTIADGLPPYHGCLSILPEFVIALENLRPFLQHHFLCSLTEVTPTVTCLITKKFMFCTHLVANKVGVPRVVF